VIGGVDDHVHALFALSKNHALKKVVEEVKKASSKWMKRSEVTGNAHFHWQAGYAGFSVSQSNIVEVRRYIENQNTACRDGKCGTWASTRHTCPSVERVSLTDFLESKSWLFSL